MFPPTSPPQSFPVLEKFDEWNEEKKYTESQQNRTSFKERDIFYIKAGKNIGFEQNGKWEKFARPFVVVRKFNNQIFWWVPLTTKKKEWQYYYSFFCENIEQTAIISQLKLVDAKRMLDKIGMIPQADFNLLKQKIKNLL